MFPSNPQPFVGKDLRASRSETANDPKCIDDLPKLLKRRSIIKGQLTRFTDYTNNIKQLDIAAITSAKCKELELKISKVQFLMQEYEETQSEIDMLHADVDIQVKERELIENQFIAGLAICQDILETAAAHKQGTVQGSVKENSLDAVSCQSKMFNSIKLPTIKLPTFDGNYLQWLEFKDTFESMINSNENIPDINKFHYLRAALEGSASVVVKSIEFSAQNYKVAWGLLCQRYHNKNILINNHLKTLLSIEPLARESFKALRFIVDHVSKHLRALDSLGQPTDKWDSLVIYIVASKLDINTSKRWEEYKCEHTNLPTITEFFTFLRGRADVLETAFSNRSDTKTDPKFKPRQNPATNQSFVVSVDKNQNVGSCKICDNKGHPAYRCAKFKAMSVPDRFAEVNKLNLCNTCLCTGHATSKCKLKGGCRVCRKRHNTLLHTPDDTRLSSSATDCTQPSSSLSLSLSAGAAGQVLLCTALVQVVTDKGTYTARTLLDTGSQSSLMTEEFKSKLGLSCESEPINIVGVNNAAYNITEVCRLKLKSRVNDFKINVQLLIIPHITNMLPNSEVNCRNLQIPDTIELADPTFSCPSQIDILLGADVYWHIIGSNIVKLGPNKPVLQSSQLGWLVAGPVAGCQSNPNPRTHCNFTQEIRESLEKFWEIDDLPQGKTHSPEEQLCESHFRETATRLASGRFSVSMPLGLDPAIALGKTYYVAKKCFLNLEKKFERQPNLKQRYREFLQEYAQLGHLTKVEPPQFGYYMPHHAVLKENHDTTKLRVVFNASFKTSTGKSLNDIQMVGPVVQSDLMSILLRFRQHKFVLIADIEKFYRQLEIVREQRHLQLVLWRDEPDQPLDVLQLNTVTYGTASAPFLSTRCLLQLAIECTDDIIADVIKNDFYVDDLNTGCDSAEGLEHIMKGVVRVLESACLPLRKFRTNCPQLSLLKSGTSKPLDLFKESSVLGFNYSPKRDTLQFSADLEPAREITKRTVISTTAKIFDPLGLLSACIIVAKILLQQLWLTKLDWDEAVPADIARDWKKLLNEFAVLFEIQVPRLVICDSPTNIELHCFVDASQHAYAACVYLRSQDSSNLVLVKLLCAKARVAPTKPVTIPRLELCGALLGARLSSKVSQSLRCTISHKFIWTDSTVVLGWLKTPTKDLKAFVCNRVNEVNELTPGFTFYHVPTDENPADLASRGISPNQLRSSSLWWEGPSYLKSEPGHWPKQTHTCNNTPLPEIKVPKNSLKCNVTNVTNDNVITRFSNLNKLKRAFAYVLRFINNCKPNSSKLIGPINAGEMNNSLTVLVRFSQAESFAQEIECVSSKKPLHRKSKLLPLTPFLDSDGVLRVGGRIQNSEFDFDKKHPRILDAKHHLTRLIMVHEHIRLFHAGPQSLLASVREQFWPIGGRILARSIPKKCTVCVRLRGSTVQPIMGHLPSERNTPTFAFYTCGVDMAGPFMISSRKGRGNRITKCYLCLFVCLTSKAVHLELVSDLSTESFILALRRFIARRGKPAVIYCDNGTNFKGANNELNKLLKSSRQSVSEFACNEGIQFKFSPAYAPTFGGIWEAGVKSAKHHLRRVVGNASLTFEELATLFIQIEAILNSRPLSPLSSDPSDPSPLTPGHFLIGRPLTSLPHIPIDEKRPNRYRYIEKLRQHFWERWRKEFIAELQQRAKWKTPQQELHVGDLVLLKDDNTPPLQWRLARVKQLYPGADGVARVADVTTSSGVFRRAINKMCPLPTSMKDDC